MTPIRFAAAAAAVALFAIPAAGQAASPAIAAAIADPGRPDKDTAQDASRKPAEIVEFARVKPGETVMDIWPGRGYCYVPAEIADFKGDPVGIAKAIGAEPGHGNVVEVSDPLASDPPAQYAETLDVAFIFENYHDTYDPFMKGADVAAYNRAVFKLLKHGGYYVVVDHAAPAGSGLAHTNDTHRIDPAMARSEIEKAGFVFDGETKVLANPDDPKTALVFDPSIRGKTDRFAYRFRKP